MSLIIAEIGTSHEGSEKKAFQLIDCAVSSGCDAVKFQWVYADEILHPDTGFVKLPTGNIRLYDRFKQLECSPSFYKKMCDYAHSKGVKFACSPFGLKSLKELLEIRPDIVKIASPELNHFPMLKRLSEYREEQKKKGESKVSVIVSSGVSTLSDIEKALGILGTEDVSLLHCITSYPAPEDEYNLKLISSLKNIFGISCGVSDHSLDPVLVPSLSIACGGEIVEKHITLSRKTEGLDDPVALEGEQFALMVHCVHQTEAVMNRYGKERGLEYTVDQLSESFGRQKVTACLGDGVKKLAESEKGNYGRTNRSLHYMKNLKKGDVIKPCDIGVLRTEKVLTPGISPEFLEIITGSVLCSDVQNGEGVSFSHLLKKPGF